MPKTSTSTKKPKPTVGLDDALAGVPKLIRTKLIKAHADIKKNALESRLEPTGLAVGKFCEAGLRCLQNKVLGSYTPFGTQIPNFADVCRKLIEAPKTSGTESERVVLPRVLVFLYTMRSKRGIGHLGGDVDANAIDISTMVKCADWTICELIRINHGLSLEEAQDIVNNLAIRQLPTIWEVAGKKRVLKDGLTASEQALLLLYSSNDSAILVEDLWGWIEYSSLRDFKRNVVIPLHKARLLEFDEETDTITLSPKGVARVEEKLL